MSRAERLCTLPPGSGARPFSFVGIDVSAIGSARAREHTGSPSAGEQPPSGMSNAPAGTFSVGAVGGAPGAGAGGSWGGGSVAGHEGGGRSAQATRRTESRGTFMGQLASSSRKKSRSCTSSSRSGTTRRRPEPRRRCPGDVTGVRGCDLEGRNVAPLSRPRESWHRCPGANRRGRWLRGRVTASGKEPGQGPGENEKVPCRELVGRARRVCSRRGDLNSAKVAPFCYSPVP